MTFRALLHQAQSSISGIHALLLPQYLPASGDRRLRHHGFLRRRSAFCAPGPIGSTRRSTCRGRSRASFGDLCRPGFLALSRSGVSDLVEAELAKLPGVRIVEREHLDAAVKELSAAQLPRPRLRRQTPEVGPAGQGRRPGHPGRRRSWRICRRDTGRPCHGTGGDQRLRPPAPGSASCTRPSIAAILPARRTTPPTCRSPWPTPSPGPCAGIRRGFAASSAPRRS